MAILEEQGTKANNEAVWNCSFLLDKTLQALHAGAVQPNPNIKGINDFPGNPNFFKKDVYYIGTLEGKMFFNYKSGNEKLYLVPNIKIAGKINLQTIAGLDSLALSYTGERTNFGPIYQIDKLIFKK